MKRTLLIFTLTFVVAFSAVAQKVSTTPLWQGKGRIAISSDGNEHDWDDWAASAMNLAIISSQGLQDKLSLYTYSDHIWGSSQEHPNEKGMSAYDHVRESVLQGAKYFGFNKTKFICAVDNAEVAYMAMRDEINRSSADDPLYIIAAGPMQVVGEAMNRADRDKMKYVTFVSHSGWNNNHSDKPETKHYWWDIHTGWTWDEMKAEFEQEGATFVKIVDQNHGGTKYTALQSHRDNFEWLLKSKAKKNYAKGSWAWLYTRLESCALKQNTVFDVSDTGMVVFLLTGNQYVTPQNMQTLMESK